MSRIILIETSTSLCSTALSEDGKIVSYKESVEPRAHASLTAVFVQEMLAERGLRVKDCDAVCLSMGPGSYTGLRVGSSTAKGLCFGGDIPLIAVSTTEVLAYQAIEAGLPKGCRTIIPLIDARRMEVYSALYSPSGEQLTEIKPLVVEAGSFDAPLAEGPVAFIGDGASKCETLLQEKGVGFGSSTFTQCCPKACSMLKPALREFSEGRFRDTAYFEPFYLKDFVATVSRKNVF